MTHRMTSPAEKLQNLQQRIQKACEISPERAKNVRLVAVSKRHPAAAIAELFALGQADFGENYLQEALGKQQALADLDICWHFIGALQSNKTRAVAENFAWVHSLDSPKRAERLAKQRPRELGELNICLQVNIDEEDSKAGISVKDVPALAEQVQGLAGLRLRGLMALPNAASELADKRASMHAMAELYRGLQTQHKSVDSLSMGMSADLEIALAAGANLLRVGEALFGPRPE